MTYEFFLNTLKQTNSLAHISDYNNDSNYNAVIAPKETEADFLQALQTCLEVELQADGGTLKIASAEFQRSYAGIINVEFTRDGTEEEETIFIQSVSLY